MDVHGYRVRNLAQLAERAEERECTLYSANPDELTLDIDQKITLNAWMEQRKFHLELLAEKFKEAQVISSWNSRHGNLHVVIRLGKVLPKTAMIALQASLGSDPVREILATWEALVIDEHADEPEDTRSLFRPKGALS